MKAKFFLLLIVGVLFNAGSVTEKLPRAIKFLVQGGFNHVGITDNTDLSIVSNAEATPESTVDAYSGSARTG